ncbi:sensor histidine kinase [Chitinilyticum piscinae]|uniref:Histidine kinase n=1 Tax=Chitinilyticum piscinae TaxID=2866724 RepID=A0A8J7K151_9NEIS|nr:histidine kinase [Chitinilyticum piscinae]MBE9608152.1 histidine kinase [Chitinilyticum piscinae]
MNDPIPAQLPDFRNLGVTLRALVLIHLAAILSVIASIQSWAEWPGQLGNAVFWIEPVLLPAMGLLALLSPTLQRLSYRLGVLLVFLLVSVVMTVVYRIMRNTLGLELLSGMWLRQELLGLAATGLLLGYYRLWMRALSPRLTEARLAALQARIRPHFFFNSLNAVLSLIRSEPKKAEILLMNLSDLFRVAMGKQDRLSTLEREVELASGYLDIEKVRLGERLQVEWHIDKMPAKATIPALILQPLLENAVYHGIESSIAPGTILINLFRVGDDVHIDIRNPVNGSAPVHQGNGMALDNVRERLLLYFDAEASLSTKLINGYYQVHIVLPYQELPDEQTATHLSRR